VPVCEQDLIVGSPDFTFPKQSVYFF